MSRPEDLPLWVSLERLIYIIFLSMVTTETKFISDAMQALVYYLNKRGLSFSSNSLIMEKKRRAILSKLLPKWLDADLSYFCDILNDENLDDNEKIRKIKERRKSDFPYKNHPPRWLQSP